MFLDSSVRSTLTISWVPAAAGQRRRPVLHVRLGRAGISSAASTPSGCTAMLVTWPRWLTCPAARSTLAPRMSSQQSMNASAQRWHRNPAWSAPSIPSSTALATSSGSIRK